MAETEKKRRIVFMGTSEFAAIILERLAGCTDLEIVGVYTQPDKNAGRGLHARASSVKQLALEHHWPVFQPVSLRDDATVNELAGLCPDFIIVAAYGLILPQKVIDLPAIDIINVHASILPRYRGAAPIQRAIMENWAPDARTGVSIMRIEATLDTGPVFAIKEVSIGCQNSKDMQSSLARLGADLLLEVLEKIISENLQPVPQDEKAATYAAKLSKADGLIDWNCPVAQVDALVRAVTPWPGAQTVFNLSGNNRPINVTVYPGVIGDYAAGISPGTIFRTKQGLKIACSDCWYELLRIRPQDRKEMTSTDFANGQCRVKNGICGQAAPDK